MPEVWRELADRDQLHDTMLLDQLIALAKSDADPRSRSRSRDLGLVASEFTDIRLDKNDPYRLRYSELLDADWSKAKKGFFEYAVNDALATIRVWKAMKQEAMKSVSPGRFGLLTESLQTRASIVLRQIELNGLHVDLRLVQTTQERLQAAVLDLVSRLRAMPAGEGLFKTCPRSGELQSTAAGKPQIHESVLRGQLQAVAERLDLEVPRTQKTRKIKKSLEYWLGHAGADEFVRLWTEFDQLTKLLQFFGQLQQDRIHPKYHTLVRTGRTSCSGPNIQQLPRKGGLRENDSSRPRSCVSVGRLFSD